MGEVILSIIVPIYNVAEYLPRGIDSVLSQSFREFELILVDDGSTDDSGRMCDEYVQKDERVKVIHKKNGGVSSARNAGLEQACGEWVYFFDPDDELMEDGLLALVNGISDDVDVVLGGFEEINIEGQIIISMKEPSGEKRHISWLDSLKPIFAPYSDEYSPAAYLGYVWIRLFRMKVINDFGLRFDESVSIKESGLFTVAYQCASRGETCCLSKPVYRYFHRPTSTMRTLWSYNRAILSSFYATVSMLRLVSGVYSSGSEIVRRAKEEVMERYHTISGMMVDYGTKDKKVLAELRKRCVKELGIPFLVGYVFLWLIRKMRKRARGFFNRIRMIVFNEKG